MKWGFMGILQPRRHLESSARRFLILAVTMIAAAGVRAPASPPPDDVESIRLLVQFEVDRLAAGWPYDRSPRPLNLLVIRSVVVPDAMVPYLARLLRLGEREREVAEALHEDYWRHIVAIDVETKRSSDKAGWNDFVRINQEVRERGQNIFEADPAVLEEMAEHAEKARTQTFHGMRLAEEETIAFLDSLFVLSDASEADHERAHRLLRRWNLLPIRSAKPTTVSADIDLFRLVATASLADGEMHGLLADEDHAAALTAILVNYESEIDRFLVEELERKSRHPRTTADVRTLPGSREEGNVAARWSRQYALTRRAVDDIGALLAEARGKDAARAWTNRFLAQFCPDAVARRAPEVLIEHLDSIIEPPPDELQRQTIATIADQYTEALQRIRGRLIRAVVAARRDHMSHRGTSSKQLAVAAIQHEEKVVIEETIGRIRRLLDAERQRSLDAWFEQLPLYATDLLGPSMSAAALELLRQQGEVE